MYRLRIGSIPLPPIYICEDNAEAVVAEQQGVPYLVKPEGIKEDLFIKLALFNTLKNLFPYIDWYRQLGVNTEQFYEINVKVPSGKNYGTHASYDENDFAVVDYTDDWREFNSGIGEDYHEQPLDKYVGDLSAYVNIEELQDLNLLPSFLSDITDSIRRNVYGSRLWSEGYNKKLGAAVGNFNQDYEAPNLIILDISGSIPRGVSATMLTLIHTLRERAHADVIITGSTSYYWKYNEELPNPQWIRNHIGCSNESAMFHAILRDHILGHTWGNVICFGDYDCPNSFEDHYNYIENNPNWKNMLANTHVNKAMFYHTRANDKTGYGRWIFDIDPNVEYTTNRTWCKFMRR